MTADGTVFSGLPAGGSPLMCRVRERVKAGLRNIAAGDHPSGSPDEKALTLVLSGGRVQWGLREGESVDLNKIEFHSFSGRGLSRRRILLAQRTSVVGVVETESALLDRSEPLGEYTALGLLGGTTVELARPKAAKRLTSLWGNGKVLGQLVVTKSFLSKKNFEVRGPDGIWGVVRRPLVLFNKRPLWIKRTEGDKLPLLVSGAMARAHSTHASDGDLVIPSDAVGLLSCSERLLFVAVTMAFRLFYYGADFSCP